MLDMFDGLVEFFTTMKDLNKYDIHLFHYFPFLCHFCLFVHVMMHPIARQLELDHVKLNLVHEFFGPKYQYHTFEVI